MKPWMLNPWVWVLAGMLAFIGHMLVAGFSRHPASAMGDMIWVDGLIVFAVGWSAYKILRRLGLGAAQAAGMMAMHVSSHASRLSEGGEGGAGINHSFHGHE